VEKASDRGTRQDFWTASEPSTPYAHLESGSFLCFGEVRHRGPLRVSGPISRAFGTRSHTEAVLPACNRGRRVGHKDFQSAIFHRGPTIRTKAATTAGTILAVAVLAGCGGSDSKSSGISDKFHSDYVSGCTSTGQTKAGCECIYTNLTQKQGINTETEFKTLSDKVKSATTSGNLSSLPPEFRDAVLACKSQIVKPPGG
jgi:hypothetical protein